MFQKIFDNLDKSYDEVKSLLKNKKVVDAYSILKEREEADAKYLFVLVNILLKKYKKASEIMEELNPSGISITGSDIFYETKGLCYFEQKNYLEATKNFIKALDINPMNFYSKYNLTMIYLLKKDYENAERGLLDLLEVEPENDILKENLRLLREKNRN
jgi:tetratricopeptide (TPR) repeat protein